MKAYWEVLALELRKVFAYRVDFWISFTSHVVVVTLVSQVVWTAVFQAKGVQELNGFRQEDLLRYSLWMACVSKVVLGNNTAGASDEIYQGGLNKYLLYPISFFGFKYAARGGEALIGVAQTLLCIGIAAAFGVHFALDGFGALAGLYFLLQGITLYFLLLMICDLVAFWADGVWSFSVMIRLCALFCGGQWIPLNFFPDPVREVIEWTPFPYMLSLPVRAFMGTLTSEEAKMGFVFGGSWLCLLFLFSQIMFSRGLKRYSGVGI